MEERVCERGEIFKSGVKGRGSDRWRERRYSDKFSYRSQKPR